MVSYDQNTGEVTLHNYMDFLNLKDYLTVSWEVLCDGVTVAEGCVEDPAVLDIPAHGEGSFRMPVEVPERGKAALKVSYALKESRGVSRKDLRWDLMKWRLRREKMSIRS